MLEQKSHRYFIAPKYRIGDVVIIKVIKTPVEAGKTLEQGVVISAWINEDYTDADTFLNEWVYKIKVVQEEIVKREKSILFKIYENQR